MVGVAFHPDALYPLWKSAPTFSLLLLIRRNAINGADFTHAGTTTSVFTKAQT